MGFFFFLSLFVVVVDKDNRDKEKNTHTFFSFFSKLSRWQSDFLNSRFWKLLLVFLSSDVAISVFIAPVSRSSLFHLAEIMNIGE